MGVFFPLLGVAVLTAAVGTVGTGGDGLEGGTALQRTLALQKELDTEYVAVRTLWEAIRPRIPEAGKVADGVLRSELDLDVLRAGFLECFRAPEGVPVQCGGGPAYRALLDWRRARASEMAAVLVDQKVAFLDQLRVDFLAVRGRAGRLLAAAARARAETRALLARGEEEGREVDENPLESSAVKAKARSDLDLLVVQVGVLEGMAGRVEGEIKPLLEEMDRARDRVVLALERYADVLPPVEGNPASAPSPAPPPPPPRRR